MSFLHLRPVKYYFSSDKSLYESIHDIFGYYPNNIFLYKLAFLHKSAGQDSLGGLKVNNERLEFLGDAVLDAVAADYLFKTFPLKDEGFLTEMRSKIVSRVQLNRIAQKMGLNKLVQLDTGSSNQYKSFQGDALEAVIGAMYLDKGYVYTRKVLLERLIRHYFNIDDLVNQEVNFKSKMIEWSQRRKKQVTFIVIDESGTGYKKLYNVEIQVDSVPIATGQDYSIKGAEQLAAEKAWAKIQGESEV